MADSDESQRESSEVFHPEMVRHVSAVGKLARNQATALALRMQASAMRSQGELLVAQAAVFEREAERIARGEVPPEGRTFRLVGDDEAEPDEPKVAALARYGGDLRAPDGGALPNHMQDFLGQFADRWFENAHFIDAVNDAAGHEMVADEQTARYIVARVGEREQDVRTSTADMGGPLPDRAPWDGTKPGVDTLPEDDPQFAPATADEREPRHG